ncbi:tyrosine-type recombinase/integrase [Nocardiopsis aegyptia]|uniref:Integrase n=1 Tax=Nocardiopsis aegyptia TaxID=220378 RepID=A0A7Z0ENY2_9ACTN|nr:site-specific integrase [Nocardiopsis aegyptia]NYJ35379.1 integrase [Nocardiopsis aegyptia]
MGFSRKRVGRAGRPRYTAYFKDIKGKERSAGTFANKRDADRAWQRAGARLAEGRVGDPARGRKSFQRYVEETWLPNHEVEATTRQSYTYSIRKHIMPEFGPMRMVEILPEHVRAWVAKLKDAGVSPVTIKYNKVLLSTIFTTALNDQVVYLHPCKGVRTPHVAVKPRTIVTPEQFDSVYRALPAAWARLLVETAIESGLRWGELSELRVRDLDTRTRILTVSRAVVEVNPEFHPTGGRFLVKEYPKGHEYRRFKLSTQIVRKLQEHVAGRRLRSDDLLFPMPAEPRTPKLRAVPDPDTLGRTEPNDKGRTYKHGTLSAYAAGKCRCRYCKDAYALYRARRRAEGKDDPRLSRTPDTDGHISSDRFRRQVWKPAITAADIGVSLRMHDLRQAHASWLLAGGADLQIVKERLGHADIATTARYLHTLPDADETALDALSRIRNRSSSGAPQ